MNLEETFTDAEIEESNYPFLAVNLKYKGRFQEDNSPAEDENDKVEETYGKSFLEKVERHISMEPNAHYLTFYGENIKPEIRE